MQIALIGYGSVGKAFARLLESQRKRFPFRITAIDVRRGTVYEPGGLPLDPVFGPKAASIAEFLDTAQPEVVIEITSLNPIDGQPAIDHIRAAFSRGLPVITANKGPLAHAYRALAAEAALRHVPFRFESTVMDGSPVFSLVRNNLPGVTIHSLSGVLNSTTKIVLDHMAAGHSLADGIAAAQALGLTEADPSYDIDGWDAAAKTAALANVLFDADVTPHSVDRQGIGHLTPADLAEAARRGQRIALVSRIGREPSGALRLSTRPEHLDPNDLLALAHGTSNILLLDTDLMGTQAIVSVSPGVAQTAYGLFSDLIDIAKTL